ncbi:hypothetical protein QYM36_010521 [Artemia franciscana]|uniref:Reverse transcriptase domain-containing protein n=1 Tax=Artemia franciscana TaxID=6661 RepID=A0AA88I600_ARTSF|nr:hypothetical protein QYM36_010521 [Artemia franciscana]
MKQAYDSLKGLYILVDDLLIYDRTKKEDDKRLKQVLQWAQKLGIKLNKIKCKFKLEKEIRDKTKSDLQLKQLETTLKEGQSATKANWTKAEIVAYYENPRSYMVRTAIGSQLRRNHIHISQPQAREPGPHLDSTSPETLSTLIHSNVKEKQLIIRIYWTQKPHHHGSPLQPGCALQLKP